MRSLAFAIMSGALMLIAAQQPMAAQSTLRGRVLIAGAGPLGGAEVSVASSGHRVRTDTLGAYELSGLAGAEVVVEVRAIGFKAASATIALRAGETATRDFTLTRSAPVQPLPEVSVVAPETRGIMGGFNERRQQGIGRFIDRDALEKWSGRRMSEMFATVPGTSVRNAGARASVATTRSFNTGACAFCTNRIDAVLDGADIAAGARPACYMDIYMDGSLVYQFGRQPPQPLFNMNDLTPGAIEAIEVYSSAAQIPPAFNRTSSGCGVVLIWTRISVRRP